MASKRIKKLKREKTYTFDFLDSYRGPMALLGNDYKQQVRCTVWPRTLMAMHAAKALKGSAYQYAEDIRQAALQGGEEGPLFEGDLRPDTQTVPGDGISATWTL